MRIFRFNQRVSLWVTWFTTYMLITVFLLGVVFFVSRWYDNVLIDEINKINDYKFEQTSKSVNDNLMSMENLHRELLRNETIKHFVNIEDPMEYYTDNNVYNLLDNIKTYNNTKVNYDMLYIYVKETDYVMSIHGIQSSKNFYDLYYNGEIMGYDEWIDTLKSIDVNKYITTSYMKDNQKMSAVAYVFQLPMQSDKAIGVIISNKNRFLGNSEDINWISTGDIYVYNAFGKLIINQNTYQTEQQPYDLHQLEGYNNKKSILYTSQINVEGMNWTVAAVVERDAVGNRTRTMRTVVAFVMVLCLATLTFAIRIIVRKNYKPIRELMNVLEVKDKRNEYMVLHGAIHNLLDKNKLLSRDIDDKNEKMIRIELARIIQGELSASFFTDGKHDYGITFSRECFSVLIFHLEDIDELFANDHLSEHKRKFYLGYIINNVFSELFAERKVCIYNTEINSRMVCLLNSDVCSKAISDTIKSVADEGVEFINHHFEISLVYALSDIHKGVVNIVKAYGEAVETMENIIMLGMDESMKYTKAQNVGGSEYVFTFHRQQSLVNCIKAGDYRNAESFVEEVFKTILENKNMSMDYIKLIMYDLAGTVIKSVMELNNEDWHLDISTDLYKGIQNSEYIGNMRSQILSYIKKMCSIISENRKTERKILQQSKRISDIMEYIYENYTNPDMNISFVANVFEIAPSYISKLFKESTGENMMDYINKLRIKRAKQLMEDPNESLKNIAAESGFYHIKTFYRVYKKHEGSTPIR